MDLYRSFFDNNELPILIIDTVDGSIVAANAAATDFYGYPREKLLGMTIDAINTASLPEVLGVLRDAKMSGVRSVPFRHRLAGGSVVQVISTVGPVDLDRTSYVYSLVQVHTLLSECMDPETNWPDGQHKQNESMITDHLVKNQLQLLDSLVSLNIGGDVDRIRDQVLWRIRAKIQIIASVYDFSIRHGDGGRIPIAEFAGAVAENVRFRKGEDMAPPTLKCSPGLTIDVVVANSLGFILDYMVEEAFDWAKGSRYGTVRITVFGNDESYQILVCGPAPASLYDEEANVTEREIAEAAAKQLGSVIETGVDRGGERWLRCRFGSAMSAESADEGIQQEINWRQSSIPGGMQ